MQVSQVTQYDPRCSNNKHSWMWHFNVGSENIQGGWGGPNNYTVGVCYIYIYRSCSSPPAVPKIYQKFGRGVLNNIISSDIYIFTLDLYFLKVGETNRHWLQYYLTNLYKLLSHFGSRCVFSAWKEIKWGEIWSKSFAKSKSTQPAVCLSLRIPLYVLRKGLTRTNPIVGMGLGPSNLLESGRVWILRVYLLWLFQPMQRSSSPQESQQIFGPKWRWNNGDLPR